MDQSKSSIPHQPLPAYAPEQVGFAQPPYPVQAAYPVQAYHAQETQQLPYPPNASFANQQNAYPPPNVGFANQQNSYPPDYMAQSEAGQQGYPGSDPPPYHSPNDSSVNILSEDNWTGFSEKAIRNAFIRKVYAILMLQLAFTVGIVSLFVFEKRVQRFVHENMGMYVAAYILFLAVYIALACCKSVRRKHPTNIILLAVFTVALTYLVATISSFHETSIVVMALGICAACCLAITVFSFFTKFDFTSCAGVLFVLSWVLFLFGIIAICTYRYYPILNTVYAGLGALLFMLFLAFDTQMVMGGKKYQLSPEEYVFAALQLYIDIVYIFLFILALLGGGKK